MPYVLILLGCIGLGLSCFGLLNPWMHRFDIFSVTWFSAHRLEILDPIALSLSTVGGLPATLMIIALWCIYQAWYKRYLSIAFICSGILGSASVGWALKYLIDRPRPDIQYQMVHVYGASFPSAHSIYAMALACLVMFIFYKHSYAKLIMSLACLWWLCMGFSRVYLGAHFPTDVLAGWSIGLIWIAILKIWISHSEFGKTKYF